MSTYIFIYIYLYLSIYIYIPRWFCVHVIYVRECVTSRYWIIIVVIRGLGVPLKTTRGACVERLGWPVPRAAEGPQRGSAFGRLLGRLSTQFEAISSVWGIRTFYNNVAWTIVRAPPAPYFFFAGGGLLL